MNPVLLLLSALVFWQPVSAEPIVGILLFDVSASMEMPGRQLEQLAGDFGDALAQDDRFRIGTVAARVLLSPNFERGRRPLALAVRSLTQGLGPSPLWDGVYEAAIALEQHEGRRAIIVVTDGRANGNRRLAEEATATARASGCEVSIVLKAPTASDVAFGLPAVAAKVATETGGTLVIVENTTAQEVGWALNKVLAHHRRTAGPRTPR